MPFEEPKGGVVGEERKDVEDRETDEKPVLVAPVGVVGEAIAGATAAPPVADESHRSEPPGAIGAFV